MSLLPGPPRSRPIDGRDVALTLAVLLGTYLLGMMLIGILFGIGPASSAADIRIRLMANMAIGFFVLFGAVYGVMIRIKGYSWTDLGVVAIPPPWPRVAVLLGLVAVPLALLVATLVTRQTGTAPQELTRALAGSGLPVVSAVTFFLYIALLLPIAEELVFRGMIFGWIRKWQSFPVANLLCAAAFAIVHMQLIAIVVTFLVGLVLGWLRERSGSVLAPILMHQVYNGATLILTFGMVLLDGQRG